jgi:multidrug efflux pump subunit AcrA (membrane-fusion protein)
MTKRRRTILISAGAGALILLLIWAFGFRKGSGSESLLVKVKRGDFSITVISTGELQARNSENIMGPMGMRNAGVWQVKISDLVPEGTVVKAGAYIATLDRVEITTKLKDLEIPVAF